MKGVLAEGDGGYGQFQAMNDVPSIVTPPRQIRGALPIAIAVSVKESLMSQPQHAQHLPSIHVPLHRRSLAWIVGLLLAGAIATCVVVLGTDSGGSSSSPSVSSSTSGPNETARGASVATAVGAPTSVQSTGPNETARGLSAASAVGRISVPTINGPNETARGTSVASAAQRSSVPTTGGPDESMRGQASASATR
jgi:hypothetical protein